MQDLKNLLFRLLVTTSMITFSFITGWEVHTLYLYYNRTTEYVDINLCREFACHAADEEIKHWLNMFDMQQEHLTNCYGLNKVYREVMERNTECFRPINPQDFKDLQPNQ